jgi:hypothetical protein
MRTETPILGVRDEKSVSQHAWKWNKSRIQSLGSTLGGACYSTVAAAKTRGLQGLMLYKRLSPGTNPRRALKPFPY